METSCGGQGSSQKGVDDFINLLQHHGVVDHSGGPPRRPNETDLFNVSPNVLNGKVDLEHISTNMLSFRLITHGVKVNLN